MCTICAPSQISLYSEDIFSPFSSQRSSSESCLLLIAGLHLRDSFQSSVTDGVIQREVQAAMSSLFLGYLSPSSYRKKRSDKAEDGEAETEYVFFLADPCLVSHLVQLPIDIVRQPLVTMKYHTSWFRVASSLYVPLLNLQELVHKLLLTHVVLYLTLTSITCRFTTNDSQRTSNLHDEKS